MPQPPIPHPQRIDLIVAVRNEEENIPVFVEKIRALQLPEAVTLRIVFVEDSSTDGTREVLRQLSRTDPLVSYYTLARGFGQGVAVVFGLRRSTADAMIMMDVDGSHPIEVIPEMIRAHFNGAKVVQCVRRTLANRKTYRRLGAATFQVFARLLTGVDTEEQNIFFRLVSAGEAKRLVEQPRYWRWLRFPLPRQPEGALAKIYVDSHERVLGESKYDFPRLVNLAVDGIVSLIPEWRLGILVGGVAVAALALLWTRLWPVSLVLAWSIVAVLLRYRRLQRGDILEQIHVVESGNAPALA